jgi:hypothetical protein
MEKEKDTEVYLRKEIDLLGTCFGWKKLLKNISILEVLRFIGPTIHNFLRAEIDYREKHPESRFKDQYDAGFMSHLHGISYAIDDPEYLLKYIKENLKSVQLGEKSDE